MIGDRQTDVWAGKRAGMRTALLSPQREMANDGAIADVIEPDLLSVAMAILAHDDGPIAEKI